MALGGLIVALGHPPPLLAQLSWPLRQAGSLSLSPLSLHLLLKQGSIRPFQAESCLINLFPVVPVQYTQLAPKSRLQALQVVGALSCYILKLRSSIGK
ncbi:unnamed protein product [Linum trigynum]|uniref:Uncharacterized protein n=1 Tax=Linum trigynum TaxID=586398 RepID=A0AAV2CC64_9ROSI